MTYFNRGGGDSRSQYYSPREGSSFGSRGSDRKVSFEATCAKCGGIAKVPFKPNGRKDVFCSKCFGEMNGEEPRYENRFQPRKRFDKPSFRAVCDQCGNDCQVPFEPRNGKPVLCSDCFGQKESTGREMTGGIDLKEINEKLDKIIEMLSPKTPKEMTKKILTEIETNIGKEIAPKKKRAAKK